LFFISIAGIELALWCKISSIYPIFHKLAVTKYRMIASKYNLVTVLGPTASGKTAFAAELAHAAGGEIISADSRQVYRKMNIGTGKDYTDYRVGDSMIPVHLIDIADPGYKYSVYEFQRDFVKAYSQITASGKLPVLCGGSGMYIEAATRNYRLDFVPENALLRKDLEDKTLDELKAMLEQMKTLHNKTDVDTKEHAVRAIEIGEYYKQNVLHDSTLPHLNTLFLGVIYERQEERRRITERLEKRLKEGMVEEVNALLKSGISPDSLVYYGLEYRYITLYLTGKLDFDTMKNQLNTAIHQFSKRQRTWFRKMEREGCVITWLNGEWPLEKKLQTALDLLKS
jgi:tRNA dimethylallyltransferase